MLQASFLGLDDENLPSSSLKASCLLSSVPEVYASVASKHLCLESDSFCSSNKENESGVSMSVLTILSEADLSDGTVALKKTFFEPPNFF